MRTETLFLLSSCYVLARVEAWGSLSCPLVGGTRFATLSTSLKSHSDEDEIGAFRRKLEHIYEPHYIEKSSNQRPSRISKKDFDYFDFDTDVNDVADNVDYFSAEYCDEDDEECEIPEEFKILPDKKCGEVMSFLGIRRAEPLRISSQGQNWQ